MVPSCENDTCLCLSLVYFHWQDALPGATLTMVIDPFFTRVITPGFYLHQVEVADQEIGGGSL